MKHVQAGKAKIVGFGTWLVEDPRRLTAIFMLITVLVAALTLATGLTHPGMLVGPNGTGGSGGG